MKDFLLLICDYLKLFVLIFTLFVFIYTKCLSSCTKWALNSGEENDRQNVATGTGKAML